MEETSSSGGTRNWYLMHYSTPLRNWRAETHTHTYISEGRDGHSAHEKIGMGEVKIHSVLLRDQLILRLLPFWPCCCGIDCFGSTFFLALG
jgi:hypothetical protein